MALGVDGIIVSNHGGRQLDGAPASIDALPAVVAAVAGRIPVLVDGGIRRGADVVKALALGAAACLIGRPQLWGLAVAGEAGVAHVLALLRQEIDLTMGLMGASRLGDLGQHCLSRQPASGVADRSSPALKQRQPAASLFEAPERRSITGPAGRARAGRRSDHEGFAQSALANPSLKKGTRSCNSPASII